MTCHCDQKDKDEASNRPVNKPTVERETKPKAESWHVVEPVYGTHKPYGSSVVRTTGREPFALRKIQLT